jgi:hypothetical protein
MRTSSLPPSIARALPDPVGYDYAPDGVTDLDDLIEAAYADVANIQYRPGWLHPDVVQQRRTRRVTRQVVRSLPATLVPLAAAECTECGTTVCDDCWPLGADDALAGEAA